MKNFTEKNKSYIVKDFKKNFFSGLTVGVLLVPQAIAYAFLAGLPPIYGLYSCLIPILIYAIFGTSPHLNIGPVAITSIILMAGISKLAPPFSESYIYFVLATGCITGIVQVFLGLLKMGFITQIMSEPVISGFISAAAIVIILSQLGSGFGLEVPKGITPIEVIIYFFNHLHEVHLLTAILTILSVSVLLISKKIKPNFPMPLVLIITMTILSYALNFKKLGVDILGKIPKGLPQLQTFELSINTLEQIAPTVFTLVIIGYMGSIGIAKSFEMKHQTYKINPNKELIALGLAKIFGTFFQGNLASGSYSRSAINEAAGATTKISGVISAGVIALTLLFLTPLIYYLPKPSLAAIILTSVFSLLKIKEAKRYLQVQTSELLVMLLTFIIALGINIEYGILTGVLLSLILFQYRSSKPHVAELIKIPNTNYYRNHNRFPEGTPHKDFIILRFDDQLYFGNSDYFKENIYSYIEKREKTPKYVILQASNIHHLDSTGLSTLENVHRDLKSKNIQMLFCGVIGPVRDVISRSGFLNTSNKKHHFMNLQDAILFTEKEYVNNSKNSSSQQGLISQYNRRKWLFLIALRKFKNYFR